MTPLRHPLRGLGAALLLTVALLCASTEALPAPEASPNAPEVPALLQWTQWPAPSSPVLAARRTASPPVVDGKLDEAAWNAAAWSTAFMDMVDASPPWLRTEVALLWDDKALYVAARMQEPWLEATIAERDGPVYRDPDIEVFIAGKKSYWELEVNARNTVYDVFWIWRDALSAAQGFDPARWNETARQVMLLAGIGEHRHPRGERVGFIDADLRGLQVAVVANGTLNNNGDTDKGWTVEIAIPWDALQDLDVVVPPSLGAVWPMNISRFVSRNAQGTALPPLRPAGWTLTQHGVFDSHVPERFAPVVFTEAGLPSRAELRALLEAHLASTDRLVLGKAAAAFMDQHADFVARVVDEAPWKDKLTPDLVRAYVLPVRVTGEPLEAWQEPLRAELLPVLHTAPAATNLTEAALRVRQWMSTRAVPGLSPPWSLGPLALLKAGAGRCEELGILFVCAARAVGIPARIAYTPAWRGTEGNHLWVEFWDGARWVALSPEQADAPPDTGWFYPLLDKVAAVQTRGLGANPAAVADPPEPLLYARDGVFTRNNTAAYTPTGRVRVYVDSSAAAQSLPMEARLYVFSGGRPRAVAGGSGPDIFMDVATGSYLLSVTQGEKTSLHCVTVTSGATTEQVVPPSLPPVASADSQPVPPTDLPLVTSADQQVPPTSPSPAASADQQVPPTGPSPAASVGQPTPPTSPSPATSADSQSVQLTGQPLAPPVYVNEAQGYVPPAQPRTAGPGLGLSQRPFPPPVSVAGVNIPFADSMYASPEALQQEAQSAQSAWRDFWGPRADAAPLAALFEAYVQSGRVDVEPFSHWRSALEAVPAVRAAVVKGNAEATAQNVRSLLVDLYPQQGSTLTALVPLTALVQSFPSKIAPLPLPDRLWAGLCVATLRSVGIPARLGTSALQPGVGGGLWVEYYDGADWCYLLRAATGYAADEARRHYGAQGIFDPADEARRHNGAQGIFDPAVEARRHHGAQGVFTVTAHGLKPAEANSTWSLCRMGSGGELFAVPLAVVEGDSTLRVPVGDYVLVAGQRDAQGMAQWSAVPVRVGPLFTPPQTLPYGNTSHAPAAP